MAQTAMIDIGRLEQFGREARELLKNVEIGKVELPTLTLVAMKQCCDELVPAVKAARTSGALSNPWQMAGLARKEVQVCNVLCQLWDERKGGEVARKFLHKFLCHIDENNGSNLAVLLDGDAPYTIQTEKAVAGDRAHRIDFLIEGRKTNGQCWLIGIEAKIDAGEGLGQLSGYANNLARRARNTGALPYLIFLSPRPPATPDQMLATNWAAVSKAAYAVVARHSIDRSVNEHMIQSFGELAKQF